MKNKALSSKTLFLIFVASWITTTFIIKDGIIAEVIGVVGFICLLMAAVALYQEYKNKKAKGVDKQGE